MKVTTKNFQILEGENKFEFNEGINMVVGPNASGKSSLFYAIENCLTNPSGVSDCINYNHDRAEVTIENNDNSVTWIRTNNSCEYKDNKINKDYIKASKLDSRDIADLGFYFNKSNVVNIHNEWSVLFPFGESDSDMFRLFEDIFNISSSFLIIDEMKKDEQQVKSSIVQNQSKRTELIDRKTKLNEIKEKVKLSDVDYYSSMISEITQHASELGKDYEVYAKSALLRNIVLPKVFDVSTLYENLHIYEDLKKEYEIYLNLKDKANKVIPQVNINLDDIKEPSIIREQYEQYCINKMNINNTNDELKELSILKNKITENISKISICPTCGRPL